MPNALIGFFSDRACTVFLKIYQCQFILNKIVHDGEEWVQLSGPYLAIALQKKNRNYVNDAINELVGLNMVKCKTLNRKQVLYRINWEEVLLACKILCCVNSEGREKLLEMCVRTNIVPISQLSDDVRNQIIRTYPNKQCSYEYDTNQAMFVTNSYEPNNIRMNTIRTSKCSYEYDTNMDNNVETEQMPAITQKLSDDEANVRMNTIRKNEGSYEYDTKNGNVRNQNVHNIYIEEENKKKMSERSSQYKEDKDKNLLDYFSSRNLSFPVFDKIFYESFLEQDLNESDDDVIKSIKTVWGQLEYDKELPDNNFIDLGTFQNILFHSWQQLKQDYPDYSLSEKDIKNIFGFIVMEHEGEPCLYIDPSKLQGISTSYSQPIQEKPSKDFKYADRTSRRLFIDCLNEIGEKDEQALTSSEFVALLLVDYATDHTSSAFSVELTKMAYKDLVKKFSKDSGVPVEDILMLFKELPQKHKVKISPQQLLPDKFFQYNREHEETSKVEKLLQKRLEEA